MSCAAQKNECPAGTGQIADQIANAQILRPRQQIGKRPVLPPLERGEFLAMIGGT